MFSNSFAKYGAKSPISFEFLQTITQKMADQGRFDLDIVLTMILCATNILFGKLQIVSESIHT